MKIGDNAWFEKRLLEVLGPDYVRVGEYVNTKTDIEIFHKKCNTTFMSKPYNLLQGYGCSKCSKKRKKTTESFKQEVFDLVGDKYTVLGEYTGTNKHIRIRHNVCGTEYDVIAKNFVCLGRRCKKCSGLTKKTKEEIQAFLDEKYPNEFKIIGEYKSKDVNMKIQHLKCGNIFEASWNNIRSEKFNCKYCIGSLGETLIISILKDLNIEFEYQKKFDDCKDKSLLPFDFYFEVGNTKVIIEYDGRQHFLPIFGNNDEERCKNLIKTQNHDEIKTLYCENNNIRLLRLKYDVEDLKTEIVQFIEKLNR